MLSKCPVESPQNASLAPRPGSYPCAFSTLTPPYEFRAHRRVQTEARASSLASVQPIPKVYLSTSRMVGKGPAIRGGDGKVSCHKGWGWKSTPPKGVGIEECCTRCKGLIKKFVDAACIYIHIHFLASAPPPGFLTRTCLCVCWC